jgi:hypothetical protein
MTNKVIHIIGGGTRFHLDSHLYLGSKASGATARQIAELCHKHDPDQKMDVQVHLTDMAESYADRAPGRPPLDTNEHVKQLVEQLVLDPTTKIVFFNASIVDFDARFTNEWSETLVGKNAGRLRTKGSSGESLTYSLELTPSEKIVRLFRKDRKDIFLVAFKQTYDATPEEQYQQGLDMLKASSANLVLANDSKTRLNMIITPEEASYCVTTNRQEALTQLVEMAHLRSHLTFTRSTVVAGDPVPWESSLVPATLRTVVDYCIERGAYRKFRGVTAGHFAVRLSDTQFLTSRRKMDFNDMKHVGLVKVETDGPDSVIAYGSRPSVGGQSQRIVFSEHEGLDCIVHFHCPKKPDSKVPTVSQREFECGSHECGANTSRGLASFDLSKDGEPNGGVVHAVYLDNHGPNLVFSSKDVDPQSIIEFIDANFDLTQKSGGYQVA